MFKELAAGMFLLLSTGLLKGQSAPSMTNLNSSIPFAAMKGKLSVGDVMPNITFENLINYKTSSARLSDFKGKLIILDFWATTCTACIGGFPKMDGLQNKFKNDIQVILVNTKRMKDTPEKVTKAFKKFKEGTGYDVTLPYMIADTVLEKYISYRYIPHHVWINGDGRIVAVTTGEEVTEENVRSILKGESAKINYKRDDLTFDSNKPLFIDNNGSPGNEILRRSTITNYIEGLGFTSGKFDFSKEGASRYVSINSPLVSIYHDAFNLFSFPLNRWIFETSVPDVFAKNDGSKKPREYCYELIAKVDSIEELRSLMQDDLVRNFKVEVIKESRLRDVYVLKAIKTAAQERLASKEGAQHISYIPKSFDYLLRLLNIEFEYPVLIDTKFHALTDKILLPKNYRTYNKKEIVTMLSEMGFALQQDKRKVDVLVFRDAKVPLRQ